MPRKLRFYSPTFAYHIINRGNNRQALFRKPGDFEFFLSILSDLKQEYAFDLYHYCLMTNHVHLLMQFHYPEGFQKVPQRLNLTYAKYFARSYGHVGHVFQDRFKSIPVENDNYLLECGRYIERNPFKAGLVNRCGDYRWSSYQFYSLERPHPFLTLSPAYLDLASDAEQRRRLYRQYVETDRPYDHAIERELFGREKVAP